jgi:hypothetical protein
MGDVDMIRTSEPLYQIAASRRIGKSNAPFTKPEDR